MAHGNAPERSSHTLVPLTSCRHMALWKVISNHLGVRMMLQCCSWLRVVCTHTASYSIDCFFLSGVDT